MDARSSHAGLTLRDDRQCMAAISVVVIDRAVGIMRWVARLLRVMVVVRMLLSMHLEQSVTRVHCQHTTPTPGENTENQ